MKIKEIFEKKIDRNINGVVKVNDNKESVLKQELEEYVVTRELKPHFYKFFNNFIESFESPTDKIGVWISGFFGSGKSHFLKILSYLLENKKVEGKPTIEYFKPKFDSDPMEFDLIDKCCSKGNIKTILFNVDSLSGEKNKDAIKLAFAEVFYNSLGYYGRSIKVVRFEQGLDKLGKYKLFKDKYKELYGDTWESQRDAFDLLSDQVVDTLVKSEIMSLEGAKKAIYEQDTNVFNIDSLVDDIKKYISKQPNDFRLVFMVDELGQYIGEDQNLMLNLQTLVEDLGTKCNGKVWLIVTAQEAIDQVIKVKGDILSKIMARFSTRISLTASSVEEVIRKRLLAKNDTGKDHLTLVYESQSSSLKNIFTFEYAKADLKGYESSENFINVYPFIPYQFHLFQDVINELREHKQVTEQSAGNARSMVGACHTGLIEGQPGLPPFIDLEIKKGNPLALFSFDRFYDPLSSKLVSQVREVIVRASDAADKSEGLTKYDVRILKLLYLIRYVDGELKATVNNIAILMTEYVDQDQIALRKKVSESLERLKMQNYISKNGDSYVYLSDEEKKVEEEINSTQIDADEISRAIGDVIFGDIYSSKKAKYGNYDFEFGRFVDDMPIGPAFDGLKFMVVTPDNQLSDLSTDFALVHKTTVEPVAYCILQNVNDFYLKLKNVLKIEKFSKTKAQSCPQYIVQARVSQAKLERNQIDEFIKTSVMNAVFYIGGSRVQIKGINPKEKITKALSNLIELVYDKLDLVNSFFNSMDDIKQLLNTDDNQLGDRVVSNPEAVEMVDNYLKTKYQSISNVSVAELYKRYGAIPYGYRKQEIAAMIIELILDQKIVLSFMGKEYKRNNPEIVKLLFGSNCDSVSIKQRIAIDPILLSKCINIMKSFTNSMDVPNKEDLFVEYAINTLTSSEKDCQDFLNNYEYGNYPQKEVIVKAKNLYTDILLYKQDSNKFLLKIKENENELYDSRDDISDISNFFKGAQKGIYDKACKKIDFFKDDFSYLSQNREANDAFTTIKDILNMERPYSRINELSDLIFALESEHKKLLEAKKALALARISDIKQELSSYVKDYSKDIYNTSANLLSNETSYIEKAIKIIAVVAEEQRIQDLKNKAISDLLSAKPSKDSGDKSDLKHEAKKEPKSVSKEELLDEATLKTQGEVDNYIDNLKSKLYRYIPNGGIKIK